MNPTFHIAKKRDGHEHSDGEIADLVRGFVRGAVTDHQMAAWAMAVCCRGMTIAETASLTHHMLHSGATLRWPDDGRPVGDKHSTGGVGDKVSLPLAAMLACCGLRVPMISGRGLGATGGTLDKLEAIPGYRTDLVLDEIQRLVDRVGCVITGATPAIAPADRKLYALRDVTGTVESIPLITASIMSKKLAEGLDALVLDVKHGSGAFMQSLDDARQLARLLVDTGAAMGVATTAVITDMNQPLGRTAGNAVEVMEAMAILRGEGPGDVVEVTVRLGAELLVTTGLDGDHTSAAERLHEALASGSALEKFREMIRAQGGDPDAQLQVASEHAVVCEGEGYVTAVNAQAIGRAIIELGGGRRQQGDTLDHAVGIEMRARLGDQLSPGDLLAKVFAPSAKAAAAIERVRGAVTLSDTRVEPPLLIVERMT